MNEQSISKVDYFNAHLSIVSIFLTIQGEGPFSGHPAIFIRLGGCNIRCPQCDTDYSKAGHFSVEQIVDAISHFARKPRLVVLTGGEPFRQNISKLVDTLYVLGYTIQIETNGTLAPNHIDYSRVYVVCSPKLTLNRDMAKIAKAFKYVLHADHISEEDGLPTSVLGHIRPPDRPPKWFTGPIYVQPVDTGNADDNKRHLDATIAVALRYGYTLCLQIHKLINME